MADDIRRLSEELARDPASAAYLPLGEALRKSGQPDLALKVALRGLERHPHEADAHDLLARIAVDRGELERAFDEWDLVRRIAPAPLGARKGMGSVLFKDGRPYDEAAPEAANYLKNTDIVVSVDLGVGNASSTVWTCDLSAEYVRINAEYRT